MTVIAFPAVGLILLSVTAAAYGVLRLWRGRHSHSQRVADCYAAIEITKEGTWFLLNLAIVNSSLTKIWAGECDVALSEFNGHPSTGYQAGCRGTLRICESVKPGETLRIDLSPTIYDAAGRPQDDYTFTISGAFRYRRDDAWYSRPLRRCRIRMRRSSAIEVTRLRGQEHEAESIEAKRLHLVEPAPQPKPSEDALSSASASRCGLAE